MAVNLSPLFNEQILTLAGVPASGYKLFTYAAGSTTKTNTYTTSAGNVANANPIVLDSNGYPSNGAAQVQIWLTAGTSYKFVLAPSTDTDPPTSAILTEDNITGVNDTVSTGLTEWTASTFTGITFVSGTQFTVTGDQTLILTLNRRLKTTNTAGTIYSYISAVDYNITNAGKTTVTVINDSGALDAGLSAVSYGIVNPTNSSLFPSANPITWFGKQTLSGAALNFAAEASLASASTVNIGAAASNNILITGTTTITAFDNVAAGIIRTVRFNGALTLTYNATSLILPGAANITTAANDCATFESLGSGNWICTSYQYTTHLGNGGHSLQLLLVKTASSSTSLDWYTNIDSTFDEYELVLNGIIPATTATTLMFRVSTDGVNPVSTANYDYGASSIAADGSNGFSWNTAQTSIALSNILTVNQTMTNSSVGGYDGFIRFHQPSSTVRRKQFTFHGSYYNSSPVNVNIVGTGVYNLTTAIVGVQIFMSSGNIASGSGYLYGIRKT